ncbi:MAG: hypothetical protein E6J90_41755 [Deltaproteobacteria bacterium]|nr:MAG: hypothetical protein E6J90_41755 [Deltaproteobacteria bacterium]
MKIRVELGIGWRLPCVAILVGEAGDREPDLERHGQRGLIDHELDARGVLLGEVDVDRGEVLGLAAVHAAGQGRDAVLLPDAGVLVVVPDRERRRRARELRRVHRVLEIRRHAGREVVLHAAGAAQVDLDRAVAGQRRVAAAGRLAGGVTGHAVEGVEQVIEPRAVDGDRRRHLVARAVDDRVGLERERDVLVRLTAGVGSRGVDRNGVVDRRIDHHRVGLAQLVRGPDPLRQEHLRDHLETILLDRQHVAIGLGHGQGERAARGRAGGRAVDMDLGARDHRVAVGDHLAGEQRDRRADLHADAAHRVLARAVGDLDVDRLQRVAVRIGGARGDGHHRSRHDVTDPDAALQRIDLGDGGPPVGQRDVLLERRGPGDDQVIDHRGLALHHDVIGGVRRQLAQHVLPAAIGAHRARGEDAAGGQRLDEGIDLLAEQRVLVAHVGAVAQLHPAPDRDAQRAEHGVRGVRDLSGRDREAGLRADVREPRRPRQADHVGAGRDIGRGERAVNIGGDRRGQRAVGHPLELDGGVGQRERRPGRGVDEAVHRALAGREGDRLDAGVGCSGLVAAAAERRAGEHEGRQPETGASCGPGARGRGHRRTPRRRQTRGKQPAERRNGHEDLLGIRLPEHVEPGVRRVFHDFVCARDAAS